MDYLKISNVGDLLKSFSRFEMREGSRPKVICTMPENVEQIICWFNATPQPLRGISFNGIPIVTPKEIMYI